MSDLDATITYDDPCRSPGNYSVGPTSPRIFDLTCSPTAQYTGTGPSSGYIIGLARTDAAIPSLHVLFQSNGTATVSADAFLVLPKDPDRRGNAYWTLGHRGETGAFSRWLAVADAAMELNYRTCADAAASVSVSANQVYQQKCAVATTKQDGTGSRVYSTDEENFGLITGATCANVPVGAGACDTLAEMLPGEGWWGTEYLVSEFNKDPTLTQGDLIRIVSTTDSNTVTFTPVSGGTIVRNDASGHQCGATTGHTFANAGDWCDILVAVGAIITSTSDESLVVGQFMKGSTDTGVGDPSLSLVLPTEPTSRFRCGGRFFSFGGYDQDAAGNGSYVNIVAPTSMIADITLDGDALDLDTTCDGYDPIAIDSVHSWTKCRLADPASAGTQHILDSGTTPIGVYVYGQSAADESYAYVGGMSF